MILGMSTATFTLLPVMSSLVGIASGRVVALGILTTRRFHPGPPAAVLA